MMERTAIGKWCLWSGLVSCFVLTMSADLMAQRIRFGPNGQPISGDNKDEAAKANGFPIDREVKRRYQKAQEAIKAEQFADAVEILDNIIRGEKGKEAEDSFYQPDEKTSVFRSLKVDAQNSIANLPAKGRETYERAFGPEAKRLLDSAITSGEVALLEKASRDFLYTVAGRDATVLLSQVYLDQGQPLSAALCLRRVQSNGEAAASLEPMLSISMASCWVRAGYLDKAKETLVALKVKNPQGTIKLGDKSVPFFDKEADAVKWLNTSLGNMSILIPTEIPEWKMFRGNPARNGISTGGSPVLSERWRVETVMDPTSQRNIEKIRKQQKEQASGVFIPSSHPLAVRDVVLMRTAKNLLAVDFTTGKRIWQYPPDTDTSAQITVPDPFSGQNGAMQARQMQIMIAQGMIPQQSPDRMWDNPTYGTLSSDGENVFLIEDAERTGVSPTEQQVMGRRRVINIGGGIVSPDALQQPNKLISLELATEGKLRWEVGGPSGRDEPKLAGVAFLGPPLPLIGKLFTIGESAGVIQLYVLDGRTGKLEWSQQLDQLNEDNQYDMSRRTAGVSPSFADGVLICPTAANSVVAVDLGTRTLLWGYRMARNPNGNQYNNGFVQADGQGGNATRWIDSCATIADGKVLIASPESEELVCLSLVDGKLAWQAKREENVYVACVHKGNAIIVGRKSILALKMADGKHAWKGTGISLPGGAVPSGRGFHNGPSYYLPLNSAAVVRIDLDTGAIKENIPSRKGYVPGNLICYKDNILSLSSDYLESFYQREPLKVRIDAQLAKDPDDADALTRRGEIAYADGRFVDSLTDLRRAYKLRPQLDARNLLVDVLMTALRDDFANKRESLGELESLLDGYSEKTRFLRIKAAGLLKVGEIAAASDSLLALADMDFSSPDPEPIDGDYAVRRERWLQGQFAGLFASAKPDDLGKIQKAVQTRLEQALAADGAEEKAKLLRRFLSFFGTHPSADSAREHLSLLLSKRDTLLEKENLLRALEHSADPVRQRSAVARLAQVLLDAGRVEDAAGYYHLLETTYAKEICLGQKTGQQMVDDLPEKSPVRKLFASFAWPKGQVDAKQVNGNSGKSLNGLNRVGFRQLFPVEFKGDRGQFFQDVSIFYDMQNMSVVARDGMGVDRWKISLNSNNANTFQNQFGYIPGLFKAHAQGHVLVCNFGTTVFAIDTLRAGSGGPESERILWKRELGEIVNNQPINRGINQMQVANPWGGPMKWQVNDGQSGQPLPGLGMVTSYGAIVQHGREIECLDLMTGVVMWTRQNVPPGADIFGDDEFLMVASKDGKNSPIVRTVDGELLGTANLPAPDRRWTTVGTNLLTWTSLNGKTILTLRDVRNNKDVWSLELGTNVKGTLLGEEVALMEPSGKLQIVNLKSGKKMVDEKLEPESSLQSLYVFRSRDQYIVVTSSISGNSAQSINADKKVIQSPDQTGGVSIPLVTGHVYALDRAAGKPQWSVPADVQKHGLVVNQGADLPVLTFVRQTYDQTKGGNAKNGILCLDKRNGRAVYANEELPPVFNQFEITADRDSKTVTMAYQNAATVLTFTDAPVPPEPPYQASLEGSDQKGAGRIFKGILNAIGGGNGDE